MADEAAVEAVYATNPTQLGKYEHEPDNVITIGSSAVGGLARTRPTLFFLTEMVASQLTRVVGALPVAEHSQRPLALVGMCLWQMKLRLKRSMPQTRPNSENMSMSLTM